MYTHEMYVRASVVCMWVGMCAQQAYVLLFECDASALVFISRYIDGLSRVCVSMFRRCFSCIRCVFSVNILKHRCHRSRVCVRYIDTLESGERVFVRYVFIQPEYKHMMRYRHVKCFHCMRTNSNAAFTWTHQPRETVDFQRFQPFGDVRLCTKFYKCIVFILSSLNRIPTKKRHTNTHASFIVFAHSPRLHSRKTFVWICSNRNYTQWKAHTQFIMSLSLWACASNNSSRFCQYSEL